MVIAGAVTVGLTGLVLVDDMGSETEDEPEPVSIEYDYEGTDTGTPVVTDSGDIGDSHGYADRPGPEIDAGVDSIVIR